MMGSGKSSVGRQISTLTGRLFSDTDAMVEAYYRMPIPKIFKEQGEDSFRQYEHEMISLALDDARPGIIATGGGAITQTVNRELIWEKAWVVYLKSSPEALLERVRLDGSRPLLQGDDDPLDTIRELLRKRGPHYRKAHLTVNVENRSVRDIARSIWKDYRAVFGNSRKTAQD
jgi:shikimate kinase